MRNHQEVSRKLLLGANNELHQTRSITRYLKKAKASVMSVCLKKGHSNKTSSHRSLIRREGLRITWFMRYLAAYKFQQFWLEWHLGGWCRKCPDGSARHRVGLDQSQGIFHLCEAVKCRIDPSLNGTFMKEASHAPEKRRPQQFETEPKPDKSPDSMTSEA